MISELEPLVMGDGRKDCPVSARLHIEDLESLRLSEDEVAEVFLLPAKWLKENPPFMEKRSRCLTVLASAPAFQGESDSQLRWKPPREAPAYNST